MNKSDLRFFAMAFLCISLPLTVIAAAIAGPSLPVFTLAVTGWMKSGNETLYAKIDKIGDRAIVLALILYIAAAVLANKLNLHH